MSKARAATWPTRDYRRPADRRPAAADRWTRTG